MNETTSKSPTENKTVKGNLTNSRPSTPTNATNWKQIAVKIVPFGRFKTLYIEKKFKIFIKLLAYKNQTVEQYGIPVIWYKEII